MAQADLEAIEDAAKAKAPRAVEYIRAVHVDPPRFSLLTGLIFCVVWLVLTFGYGWWKAHERDKWWRAQIAAKSVKVNTAIAKANAELPDDEILKTLGDYDDALRKAEELVRKNPNPADDSCPVISARCVFKR
jgi:hypothetical protein